MWRRSQRQTGRQKRRQRQAPAAAAVAAAAATGDRLCGPTEGPAGAAACGDGAAARRCRELLRMPCSGPGAAWRQTRYQRSCRWALVQVVVHPLGRLAHTVRRWPPHLLGAASL